MKTKLFIIIGLLISAASVRAENCPLLSDAYNQSYAISALGWQFRNNAKMGADMFAINQAAYPLAQQILYVDMPGCYLPPPTQIPSVKTVCQALHAIAGVYPAGELAALTNDVLKFSHHSGDRGTVEGLLNSLNYAVEQAVKDANCR